MISIAMTESDYKAAAETVMPCHGIGMAIKAYGNSAAAAVQLLKIEIQITV